ncbi:tubulin polyglutamylase complex subunit 1 [Podarcis muralis]
MATSEKRRSAAAAGGSDPARPSLPSNGAPPESEAEFLLQAGVSDMVREALLKVLEARPDEPVGFLAGYFERLAQGGPEEAEAGEALSAADGGGEPRGLLRGRLGRALWYLSLAHHSHRMAFNNNVSVAYDSLSAAGRRKKPGVSGKLYSELLRLMCQDKGTPEDIALPLLSKVGCRDHEAVPFDIFRYGVLTCLVLLEFLAKADLLFNALGGGSGAADKRVCAAVLGTLEDALCPAEVAAPIRFLEAGSKLGPDCLASAMDKALGERKPSVAMKKEEFLQRASSIFVARVKPVE